MTFQQVRSTVLMTLSLVAGVAVIAGPGSTGSAYAQNSNATIRGQVLDPTGAVIPGAQVLIVNQETNVTVFNAQSDSAGTFVAPQVQPGTYRVSVTATGLKKAVINDLIATVAQVAAVNVTMELGADTETVTVQSRDQQLDTTTSDVSTLISPQEVANLPLNLRAPENLLSFIPGVAHGGAGDNISTSQLSINGSRTLNTEVLVNGISVIVASTGTLLALPSPDGIDELRFLTSNAPAEYGRTSGAVLSANVLSGTNKFHGNAYLLMRNERLDANTFFNKLTNFANAATPNYVTKKTPRDRYFLPGGSLGGPVFIPHVYDGRNKTFFFTNYDRLLYKNSTLAAYTVPGYIVPGTTTLDLKQRTGDFSENTTVPIYQPGGTATAQYPGNIITNLDPAAVKLIALLPLPNSVGTYDAVNHRATGNYTIQPVLQQDTVRWVSRLDEQLTAKDKINLFYYRFRSSTPLAVIYNSPLLNSNYDCACTRAHVAAIDYTRVWNSTLVTDFNVGFFRNSIVRNPPGQGLGAAAQLGIASLPLDETPEILTSTNASATQGAGALSNIGGDSNTKQINITNTFPIFGTVTKVYGPHTFKAGVSYRDNEFNSYNPATYPQGQLDFDGSITNHGSAGNVSTQLADLLVGKVKTANYELPMPPNGRRNYNLGVFIQDDYKATPKLTLNIGFRYEFESPMTISNNIYSRVDEGTGQLLAANLNASRSLNITTAKVDISPRLGFAYSVKPKTVVRGAFGTFYGTIFQNLGGQIAYPGFDTTVSFLNQGTAVAQPFSLSQGFPLTGTQNLKNPFALFNAGTPAAPYAISGNQFGNLKHLPLVQQYNLGIQQQLPLGVTLEVNYVGNHGVHLPTNYPVNYVPLAAQDAVSTANTTTTTQNARPFPNISQFSETSDGGDSNYNSLQVTARRQFNKNLAILSNYTWAKSIDDASTIYNFSAPNGSANAQFPGLASARNADRGPSNIDVTNTLNIAMVYTTPGPWYTRGFKISPVFIGHTGVPLNITQTNELSGAGQQRPNGSTVGLKVGTPYAVGTAIQYLTPPPATITSPASYQLTPSGPVNATIGGVRTLLVPTNTVNPGGTVSRDSMRVPGEVDFDASVSKDIPLYGRLKFNLRVDVFNLINHTNYSAPNGALVVTNTGSVAGFTASTSPNFGKITSTLDPRKMQIVGRFTF